MHQGMVKEFKEFILRGNVIDLAVAVVIGGAFGRIVTSLVNDVIMPPIGLLLGGVDFSHLAVTLKAATAETDAVTLGYGQFLNTTIEFLIIAAVIFFIIKAINRTRKDKEVPEAAPAPTTKECPRCFTGIPVKALRCPNCTSEL